MTLAQLTARLRAEKAALASRVVDEMYADPFWRDRFPNGRRYSDEDLRYHVDHLAQALDAEDPGVLARYAKWLQSVLTTRGMCTLHLAESFERLGRVIRERFGELLPPAQTALSLTLDAAVTALRYPGPAGDLQNAAARLVQEAERAMASSNPGPVEARGGSMVCASDAAHLLSYLADATALVRPSLFVEHAAWFASFVIRRGASPEYLAALVDTIVVAIDGGHALASSTRTAAIALLREAASALPSRS